MKAIIEWKDGDSWRQVKIEVAFSRNNNYWFKHDGRVYVFPDMKIGTVVLAKGASGRWEKVGRIARSVIFLGEGETFSEYNERLFRENPKQTWERVTL